MWGFVPFVYVQEDVVDVGVMTLVVVVQSRRFAEEDLIVFAEVEEPSVVAEVVVPIKGRVAEELSMVAEVVVPIEARVAIPTGVRECGRVTTTCSA